jgi:large repetitive protein
LYSDAALSQLVSTETAYDAADNSLVLYFVPDTNWSGDTSFTYTAIDNDGRSDASDATASISVADLNNAPTAFNASASTNEETLLSAAVPNATDDDGAIVDYALTQNIGANNGTLSFASDVSYTFDPGSDFDELAIGETRDVRFNYIATDDDGAASDEATVTITVTGTNDAPIVGIGEGSLLGLANAGAVDTIDLEDQGIFAVDPDGNLRSVLLTAEAVATVAAAGVTPPTWAWSEQLANELGINVTSTTTATETEAVDGVQAIPELGIPAVPGIPASVAYVSELIVTASDGGVLDNTLVNELLATVFYDPLKVDGASLASVDALTNVSITGTDDLDVSTSYNTTGLAGVSALDSDPTTQIIYEGDDNANIIIGNEGNNRIYGYGDNDTIDGLAGDDLIRGGSGDDILNGGDGNDTLIDGLGTDVLNGDAGNDSIYVSDLRRATIDGGSGEDTLILAGDGITFDLEGDQTSIANIEILDISGSGANTLALTEALVLDITDGNDLIRIEGDSDDSLNIAGATQTGSTEINDSAYDIYQLGSTLLYVDQDIATEL